MAPTLTTETVTEAVCYGCDNSGQVELHCEQDWAWCEDGPGLHMHTETCYVCGGKGGPVTFEVADYPDEDEDDWL